MSRGKEKAQATADEQTDRTAGIAAANAVHLPPQVQAMMDRAGQHEDAIAGGNYSGLPLVQALMSQAMQNKQRQRAKVGDEALATYNQNPNYVASLEQQRHYQENQDLGHDVVGAVEQQHQDDMSQLFPAASMATQVEESKAGLAQGQQGMDFSREQWQYRPTWLGQTMMGVLTGAASGAGAVGGAAIAKKIH